MKKSNKKILALIPARSGSKGIPGKNIMDIAGKPLIAHSILQALDSKYINRVIVSTDGKDISEVSKKWGAEVPFIRPKKYAADNSPDIDVFKHTLNWLRKNENYNPDLIVHLRPTGPVRSVSTIDKAISTIKRIENADSLRSVSLALQTPYKMWSINNNFMNPILNIPDMIDSHSMPRQSLPEVYWQNGYVDIIKPSTILSKNSMSGKKVLPFIIDETLFELDYPEDIPAIEKILNNIDENIKHPKRHSV